jgi:hypothetical protein
MDTSVITAASALAGAAIGGFTSLIAAWLSHRVQARAERLAHYQLRRQELYKEFIEKASELYIHALQDDKPDLSGLMRLLCGDKQNAHLVLINSRQQRRPNR